jgi:hypothetical protein
LQGSVSCGLGWAADLELGPAPLAGRQRVDPVAIGQGGDEEQAAPALFLRVRQPGLCEAPAMGVPVAVLPYLN